MIKISLLALGLSTLLLTSCSEDDDSPATENPPQGYTVPETYNFTDGNGNSTVNFSGQTERLDQLSELTSKMKSANNAGTAISAQDLKDMFANVNNDGNGNFSFTSSKQLRDKCATQFSNAEEVKSEFETMMDDLAAISQATVAGETNGQNGVAGIVQSPDGGPYLMTANGQEYTQLISKGLMGAVFYHQMTSYYLTDAKIGDAVDNSTAVNPGEEKYYTDMEHHWDEAFGYFTSATNFPEEGTDRFWGEYSNVVDPQLGSNAKLMNAFLTGRAAISNDDMTTKNQQRDIIIAEMERVVAATAIHYMNKARDQFANDAKRNHFLSEGSGFISSLRFNTSSTLTPQEINSLEAMLGDNFYEVTISDILSIRDELSDTFGMNAFKNDL
ncbi:DUF4856 domain-containing protein [Cryomorpha ignava]|uniref:DUF4856 domain-containing protein n=1 Tax=Cryomorpha ignava TaxID=101383 RepID=A0A7K3WRL5_9FLAO|nr:DUF4856 domain-containing protein [Cryomorpha ignava]NEN24317.1 DUF4856 domain-containing protein [Cryomorpha ignava]